MKLLPVSLASLTSIYVAILSQATAMDATDRSVQWLDRPWEIRYVLFVNEERLMKADVRVGRQLNAEEKTSGKERIYRRGESLFEPQNIFAALGTEPISMFVMSFDQSGRVQTPQNLNTLAAKRNLLDHLVLIDQTTPTEKPYSLAIWSQGVPGNVSFSPAVCAGYDFDRYEDDWDMNHAAGNFGCREWTAQLYQRNQPYIDVTTANQMGTYIGEFIGWSRFGDPPKPVIGRHGKTWLCLYECPAGEKPGPISNIKAWAAKHGYPTPKPPPRKPQYPNKDYDFND